MRIRFWRCGDEPEPPPTPAPRPAPHNNGPSWATAPTVIFLDLAAGRAGNLTPAGEWRANGRRLQ